MFIQLVRVPADTDGDTLRRFRAACVELGIAQVERGNGDALDIVSGGDVMCERVRQAWEAACAGVTDVAFEEASDVGLIQYRLHPIDVGFDLREDDTPIVIGPEPSLRVSYPDERGERRVMSGLREQVITRLQSLGFKVTGVTP